MSDLTAQEMDKTLEDIVKRLKQEDTRWDAILQLKVLQDHAWVDALVKLLQDDDWVVRWCVAEKLGDLGHTRAIHPLIRLLADNDYHVRKNAGKSLLKFGGKMVPILVRYYASKNFDVREQVLAILLSLGESIIPDLEAAMSDQDWIVSNRIVDTIWRIGGEDSETALIRAIQHPYAQRHTIVLLGLKGSKRSIPYLIKGFDYPKMRRIILYSLYHIGTEETYPVIVNALMTPSSAINHLAEKMVYKIGLPITPYILRVLPKSPKHLSFLLDVLVHVDESKMLSEIDKLGSKHPSVATAFSKKAYSKKRGFFK